MLMLLMLVVAISIGLLLAPEVQDMTALIKAKALSLISRSNPPKE